MTKLALFSNHQIQVLNETVSLAEELVSNSYKLSASQWRKLKYDVCTLEDLDPEEIIQGPFAQIVRYEGQHRDRQLGSSAYDFYKICIQDHAILAALDLHPSLALRPFALYIVTHELVHIIRFNHFLQNFKASTTEKLAEENRVHSQTRTILEPLCMEGIEPVLRYYRKWSSVTETA